MRVAGGAQGACGACAAFACAHEQRLITGAGQPHAPQRGRPTPHPHFQVRVLTVMYSQVACESAAARLGGRTAGAELLVVGNPDIVRKRVVPALLVPQKKART